SSSPIMRMVSSTLPPGLPIASHREMTCSDRARRAAGVMAESVARMEGGVNDLAALHLRAGSGFVGVLSQPRPQPYPQRGASRFPPRGPAHKNTGGRHRGVRAMPDEYRIGRLNGGFVVTWWEGEGTGRKRRRYRLGALSRK